MSSSTTDNLIEVAAYNCDTSPTPFAGSENVEGIQTGFRVGGDGSPIIPPADGYEQQNMNAATYEAIPAIYDGATRTHAEVKALMEDAGLTPTNEDTSMVMFFLGQIQMPSGENNFGLTIGANASIVEWKDPDRYTRPT